MNYNIDHNLLQDTALQELKGSTQHAAWLALCAIRHFTKVTGGMDFYSVKFATDIKVKPGTMKKALDHLVNVGAIKIIREYQREGNIPRRYTCHKRYIPWDKKVYPLGQKGISPEDKVNNSKRIINQKNDDVNTSHSSSISTYKPLSREEIIKLKEGKK